MVERKPSKQLVEAVQDLETWMTSETVEFNHLVLRFLASLPGGERLFDLVDPLPVGWKEIKLLEQLFAALQNANDVRYAVDVLAGGSREDE